jgi:hypothetical protein
LLVRLVVCPFLQVAHFYLAVASSSLEVVGVARLAIEAAQFPLGSASLWLEPVHFLERAANSSLELVQSLVDQRLERAANSSLELVQSLVD